MSPCFISLPLLIPSVSSVKLWLTACGQLVGDLGLCCAAQPIRREGSAAELDERKREGGRQARIQPIKGEGQVRLVESPFP